MENVPGHQHHSAIACGECSDELEEAIELFADRRGAECVVANWDRDEPDHAGEFCVEPIELETSAN